LLIFTKSAKASERVMKSVSRFIIEKLGLKVNMEKSRVCGPSKLKFLGFGYYKAKKWEATPHPES